MHFLKKCTAIAVAVSLLTLSCISGYAAKITQDNGFAVQGETTSGTSYTATVGVKNDLRDAQSFQLITAVYSAGETPILTDVDLKPCTIDGSTGSKFYTGGEVTVASDSTVQVFVWGDNLCPLEDGDEFRTLRQHATLSAIKVGDYATVVDNQNKRIYVDTNDDISTAVIDDTSVVVSDGATWAKDANNATVTVTSEDGLTTNTYKVVASDKLNIVDFEDEDVIASDTTTGKIKVNNGTTGTVTIADDPLNASNKVLACLDTDTDSTKLDWQYDFDAIEKPYVVTVKVMYARNSVKGSKVSGTWLHARGENNKTVMALGAQDKSSSGLYNVQDGCSSEDEITNQAFALGTWHEMKMERTPENIVNFYMDGNLFHTSTVRNDDSISFLKYFSSTSGAANVYFDDICVRPYYPDDAELENAIFTDGTTMFNSLIHDGTVYVNATSLEKLSHASFSVADNGTAVYDASASTITTTTADGKSVYGVVAKKYFDDDFQSYAAGSEAKKVLPSDNYSVTLETAKANGSVAAAIDSEGTNNFLKLTDMDGDGSQGARAMVYVINDVGEPNSFIAEYKVKYEFVPGNSYIKDKHDVAYNVVEARNSLADKKQELAWMQPASYNAENKAYKLNIAKETDQSNELTDADIRTGQWYTMKMVYTAAEDAVTGGTAAYYVDGKLVSTQAITNASGFKKLFISTSKNRQSVMYIDDLKILPDLQLIDFEDEAIGQSPEGWTITGNTDTSAAVVVDSENAANQVLCLSDNSTQSGKLGAVIKFEELSPPYSVRYRIKYERPAYEKGVYDVSTSWFHLRDSSNQTIMSAAVSDLGDGSLKFYTNSANGEKTVDAYLNLGSWHEIKLSCVSENEVRFYLDDTCIYTAAPKNYAPLSKISIYTTDARMGTMYLDDITIYADNSRTKINELYAGMDAMFEGVLPWLTELYDPETGGFYTTVSGMQNAGYVPSLEATAFVYAMLTASETGALSTMPDAFKNKLITYFQGAQSAEDGFFYDYGVDPSAYSDRNKMRVYQQCVSKLKALGADPLYSLSSVGSTQAYSLLTLAAASTEIALPDGFPSYLKSVDSFIAKVASRDWDNNSWTAGDLTYEDTSYLIQLDQAVYQPYIDALFDWLKARQDSETGYWAKAEDTCFNALSGAFKVVRIYDRFNTAPPNIDKITQSIMGTLFSGETPSTACDLRNTLDALSILKSYDKETVETCLKKQERPILNAYTEYMKLFFKADGGASMYPTKSTSSFGGIPAGKQLAEGDIDGTQQMFLARLYLNKLFGRGVDNSGFAKQYEDFWSTLSKK